MILGTVTGSVWATRKIRTDTQELVAADQVGAGPGDKVLLVVGNTASRYCMDAPVDAVVVAIVDKSERTGAQL